jgi:hypothetical protein
MMNGIYYTIKIREGSYDPYRYSSLTIAIGYGTINSLLFDLFGVQLFVFLWAKIIILEA